MFFCGRWCLRSFSQGICPQSHRFNSQELFPDVQHKFSILSCQSLFPLYYPKSGVGYLFWLSARMTHHRAEGLHDPVVTAPCLLTLVSHGGMERTAVPEATTKCHQSTISMGQIWPSGHRLPAPVMIIPLTLFSWPFAKRTIKLSCKDTGQSTWTQLPFLKDHFHLERSEFPHKPVPVSAGQSFYTLNKWGKHQCLLAVLPGYHSAWVYPSSITL